jgi:biopolymer transport protein ExbD
MNFSPRHRREPMELQLTAMIDIFTMIVIFLVMGTVIGVADVSMPPKTNLPKSLSAEALDAAPQVLISSRKESSSPSVELRALSAKFPKSEKISIEEFRSDKAAQSLAITELKSKIRNHINGLTPEQRKGGVLLNVIADEESTYQDIYDVVAVFRGAGFESLLFVATGDPKINNLLQKGQGSL